MSTDVFEKVIELAKRRGFFWPSYEIYGGVAGFYDLGPLGVRLKNKIIELWREYFIQKHQELVVELETPIIGPAKVYEASGHVEHFTDPITECLRCGRKYRADHLIEEKLGINVEGLTPYELTELIRSKGIRCPSCNGELSEVKLFSLLFKTTIGPYHTNIGYLRPETAQGIFVSFKRVHECMRKKLPLGIAQVGKVARNEISPRQAMIRLREFTIAEMEFFFDPEDPNQGGYLEEYLARVENEKLRIRRHGVNDIIEAKVRELIEEKIVTTPWLAYWMAVSNQFVKELGVSESNIVFVEKGPTERAHYSIQTFDQMVKVSRFGWVEVSGHSYRTDYDLARHMKYSGQDLTVFKQYEEVKVVRKKEVVIDIPWLGRTFKSKAKTILEELKRVDPIQIEKEVKEKGYVTIAGEKIPADRIRIVEKEVKETGRRFIPHVVEPSFGVERLIYVTLEYAYTEKNGRTILRLPRKLAPYEAAVFPLTRDERLVKLARKLWMQLISKGLYVIYDDDGSIGRRYARVDEIGVPVAVTVDYQSLEDNTVTLRDRDTWEQIRVPIDKVYDAIISFIYQGLSLHKLQEKINC